MKIKPPRTMIIDDAGTDWLTVVTWFQEHFEEVCRRVVNHETVTGGEIVNFMQYHGTKFYQDRGGTGFMGEAVQNGRQHYLIYVSGESSEWLADLVKDKVNTNQVRVSRIDLQSTVSMRDDWSQWRLFNRLKKAGKTVSFVSSKSTKTNRELSTVYIGKRASDKVLRIYEKEDDEGNVYLRFEAEYKRDRGALIGQRVVNAGALKGGKEREEIAGFLKFELQKLKDEKLTLMFKHLMNYEANRVRVRRVRNADKTRDWLISQVLPAFKKYIQNHDSDPIVTGEFQKAIDDANNQL